MEKRNYGIDLLRLLSMFFIIILHTLGHGGVANGVAAGSASAWIVNFLKAGAFCAVNCFALVTGFVMWDKKPRISKGLLLWAQTAFYTVAITAICHIVFSEGIGLKGAVNAVFPISRNQYWFMTAYMGMYLLTPVLNLAVQNMPKSTYSGLLAMLFVAFCVLPTAWASEMFTLNGGYSTIWLCVLYLVGAYLGKFDPFPKANSGKLFLCYGACVGLTFLSKLVLAWAGKAVLGRALPEDLLYQYVSPTVVLSAVFLVGAFAKLSVGKYTQKVVAFFAPAALGVYLIHDHPLVRKQLWKSVGLTIAQQSTGLMVAAIFAIAAIILLACLVVDRMRIYLFQLLRIPVVCQKIETKATHLWTKN